MTQPTCPICRHHPGVLRGPGPRGTTVRCWACRRGRTRGVPRAAWGVLLLLALCLAGGSEGRLW